MSQNLPQSDLENLSAWIDGELPPQQAEIVARNVENDPQWARAYRELLAVDQAMDAWRVPSPSQELMEKVLSRTRRRTEHLVYRIGRWVTTAAAVGLIAVGLILHFTSPRRVTGPSPNMAQSALGGGVPETFVQDGRELFNDMPEKIPQSNQRRVVIIIRRQINGLAGGQKSWQELSPQQRQWTRQRAVAFLELTPEQQLAILNDYEQAAQISTALREVWEQRMKWLQVVLKSFSPTELDNLKTLTPAEKGKTYLQRRDELIRSGKLSFPVVSPSTVSDSPELR